MEKKHTLFRKVILPSAMSEICPQFCPHLSAILSALSSNLLKKSQKVVIYFKKSSIKLSPLKSNRNHHNTLSINGILIKIEKLGNNRNVKKWSGRRDLNSRPLVPETSALAKLRYAPTCPRLKDGDIVPGTGKNCNNFPILLNDF